MIPLGILDLSTAVIGQKGTLADLNNVGISAGGTTTNPAFTDNPAHLFIYNESGFGLSIAFSDSSTGMNVPAGAWLPVAIPVGQNKINYTILYKIQNSQVSIIVCNYYFPGEKLPNIVLGNSPVSGGTTTTVGNTLSNEGSALGTEVIDIGTATNNKLVDIFNDHFTWSVEQSGISHTVIQGKTSGNPLLLGQSGDTLETLGNLQVDQGSITTGATNSIGLGTKGSIRNVLDTDSSSTYIKPGVGTSLELQVPSGTSVASVQSDGIHLLTSLHFLNGGNTRVSAFTGIGSGTFNHNLGATPSIVLPITHVNGSQTVGYDSENGTTTHVTCGSGLTFNAYCIQY